MQGRRGRGAIYLWAAGNGGGYGDNCGWDGFVNSIYTVTVTAATSTGDLPWYNERCSAILTSATTTKDNRFYYLGDLVRVFEGYEPVNRALFSGKN